MAHKVVPVQRVFLWLWLDINRVQVSQHNRLRNHSLREEFGAGSVVAQAAATHDDKKVPSLGANPNVFRATAFFIR